MARTFAVAVILLGLAGISWLVFDSSPTGTSDATLTPDGESGSPSDTKLAADQVAKRSVETNAPGDRLKLNEPPSNVRFEDIADIELVRVAIVMASTGARVSDAEVAYAGRTQIMAIPAERREWLRKQGRGLTGTIEEVGFRARVSVDGVAMIRSDPEYLCVQARRGDLFGQLMMQPSDVEPPDGWKIRLHPLATVEVRVIDSRGQPVSDVPLALRPAGTADPNRARLQPFGKTDASGSCTRELGPMFAAMEREGEVHAARIVIDLPGLTGISVSIDRADPPRDPVELVLPSTGRIRCEIVDSNGKPITGLTPTRVQVQGGSWWRDLDAEHPNPRFDRVGLGQQYNLYAYVVGESKNIRIAGPTKTGQEVVARFEFPAMGRVIVKITHASGAPFVSLRNYVNLISERGANQQKRFDDKGVATFDRVPLGQSMRAKVSSPSMEKEFLGPANAGEDVVVNVAIDASVPILTARLIDPKGKVLGGKKVRLKLRYDNGSGERILICDGAGRFYVTLTRRSRGKVLNAVLRAADKSGEIIPGSARLRIPDPLPRGVTDLGDVTFTTRAILVSGRFVGYRPDRRSLPRVTVERHYVYQRRGESVERWRTDETMHLIRISADRFEYRGDADPGRRRLQISARDYLPVDPIEFVLGTKDLEIPLRRGGALAVHVKIDETIRGEMLHARLIPATATRTTRSGEIAPNRSRGGSRRRAGEADYRWVGLTPGFYRLEFRLIGGKQPLLAVDGIEVVGGGETRDDRLQTLDLRGKIRPITVKLVGPDGKALSMRSNGMLLVKPKGKLTDLEGLSFDYGQSATFAIGSNPVDLWIVVDGYPLKEVLGVDRDTTVRLDPPRKIRIKFRGGLPTLPAGASLQLAIQAEQTETGFKGLRYRTNSMSGGLSGLFYSRSRMLPVKGTGVVGTVPRTGEHKVYCLLSGVGRRRSVKVTPAVIRVRDSSSEQEFEIEVTQAAVDAASK